MLAMLYGSPYSHRLNQHSQNKLTIVIFPVQEYYTEWSALCEVGFFLGEKKSLFFWWKVLDGEFFWKRGGLNGFYREMDKVWRNYFSVKSIPCRRSFGGLGILDSWSFNLQDREHGKWLCQSAHSWFNQHHLRSREYANLISNNLQIIWWYFLKGRSWDRPFYIIFNNYHELVSKETAGKLNDICYLCALHEGLEGFRYTDHIWLSSRSSDNCRFWQVNFYFLMPLVTMPCSAVVCPCGFRLSSGSQLPGDAALCS